jgi:hypothetical protein
MLKKDTNILDNLAGLDLEIQDILENAGKELKGIVSITQSENGDPLSLHCVHLTPIIEIVSTRNINNSATNTLCFTIGITRVLSTEIHEYVKSLLNNSKSTLPNDIIIFETPDLQEIHSLLLDKDNEDIYEEINKLVYQMYIRLT